MQTDIINLYWKYHLDRDDERLGMFKILAEHLPIKRILYPGCFVHVTPSFIFADGTYVDMDKRAKQFFTAPELKKLLSKRKNYAQETHIQFHHQDYAKRIPEQSGSFDLLISQYAGFVSQHCKRYLKIGGWLLANNSHGDASMADLDDDYELIGVVNRRGEKFNFSTRKMEDYFIPKKKIPITKEYLNRIQRGIGYQKSAFAYIFERTGE